jgi:plasmid stabilization system protein ParE
VQIRFHPGAATDLSSAGDWYEQQRPGLGADLAAEVGRALEAITERPTIWPLWPGLGEGTGVRRFLLARFPYAVGYLVEGDDIFVLAVAHLRRRPDFWLGRHPSEQ